MDHRWFAPVLLFVSAVAALAVTTPSQPNLNDFHVFVLGGAALDHPGMLYSFSYSDQSPQQPLPFVYPPFAAMVFYPLHFLPFALAGILWQLGIIAATYGIVHVARLMTGGGSRREVMLWTAGAIWLEPVRICINLGQVGVFLTLMALYAVYSNRWWISGLLVGSAAGIKLTPAITGFYFLGVRRWAAAAFSAVVFAGTVAVSYLVVGDQVRHYFTKVMGASGDTSVNPIGVALNQSWRGGISRILGHDAGQGALVLAVDVLTAVLAVWAWRALGSGGTERDKLGSLLVVQLLGLLISPISWVNHWIWLVPLIIWLFYGRWRDEPLARALGWVWVAATFIAVPSQLANIQPALWEISRPWYLAWAGLVYVALAVATLAWMVVTARRVATGAADRSVTQITAG